MRPKTRAINNDNPPGLSPGRGFEERVNRNMWWGAGRVPMDEVHEAIMPGSNNGIMPSGVPTRRATPHPALAAGGMAAVVERLAKQGPRPRDGDPALSIAPPEPKRVAPPVLRHSATQSHGSSDQGKVGEGGWDRASRS